MRDPGGGGCFCAAITLPQPSGPAGALHTWACKCWHSAATPRTNPLQHALVNSHCPCSTGCMALLSCRPSIRLHPEPSTTCPPWPRGPAVHHPAHHHVHQAARCSRAAPRRWWEAGTSRGPCLWGRPSWECASWGCRAGRQPSAWLSRMSWGPGRVWASSQSACRLSGVRLWGQWACGGAVCLCTCVATRVFAAAHAAQCPVFELHFAFTPRRKMDACQPSSSPFGRRLQGAGVQLLSLASLALACGVPADTESHGNASSHQARLCSNAAAQLNFCSYALTFWILKPSTCCRLKASLERVQRLTQGFTDALLTTFPARANALGKALGIQDERIQACPRLGYLPAACIRRLMYCSACTIQVMPQSFPPLDNNWTCVWHQGRMHASSDACSCSCRSSQRQR